MYMHVHVHVRHAQEDSTEYTLGTDHTLSLIGKEIFVSVIVHFPMKVEFL